MDVATTASSGGVFRGLSPLAMTDVARIGDVAFLVSSDRKSWIMIELKAGGYVALHCAARVSTRCVAHVGCA